MAHLLLDGAMKQSWDSCATNGSWGLPSRHATYEGTAAELWVQCRKSWSVYCGWLGGWSPCDSVSHKRYCNPTYFLSLYSTWCIYDIVQSRGQVFHKIRHLEFGMRPLAIERVDHPVSSLAEERDNAGQRRSGYLLSMLSQDPGGCWTGWSSRWLTKLMEKHTWGWTMLRMILMIPGFENLREKALDSCDESQWEKNTDYQISMVWHLRHPVIPDLRPAWR